MLNYNKANNKLMLFSGMKPIMRDLLRLRLFQGF